jgi:alkylation response protein AidB-like acyl-CoA dehydrogenase
MSMPIFNQPPPRLGNQFDDDRALRSLLARFLPGEIRERAEAELRDMGALAGDELYAMQLADRQNEPVLTQWNAWGERVDQIECSPLWNTAARIAAERGVVATAYEPAYGPHARVIQFALAYLFHPSTDVYTCPLAMTDGAARTLLASGNRVLIERAVPRLTSRDPALAWTSGQWMTESTGGSDVGRSETRAVEGPDGTWRLYGRKGFTSATTAQMALALARPEGNPTGGSGLALFYVETRDAAGCLQQIAVNRLKDKLGTRKVPTAELSLEGTPAVAVAGRADGVRAIVPMLHVTRTWNSVVAAAMMRRGIALARDYARRRVAFGATLAQQPLHADTLAGVQAEFEAALQLAFLAVRLLGAGEYGMHDEHTRQCVRIVTALAKLTTGRQAVAVASEVLEAFGGAGYVEDTGLPVLLRDSQVLPIWEGTTNVLALETMRAFAQPGSWEAFQALLEQQLAGVSDSVLAGLGAQARVAVSHAAHWYKASAGARAVLERGARRCALTLGRALALALLAGQAQWSLEAEHDGRTRAAAVRFAAHGIDQIGAPVGVMAEEAALADDQPLPVFDEVTIES